MSKQSLIAKPQIVRVTNTGNKDFRDTYGSVDYLIPKGDTIVVPWEAVTLWVGDPRFVDDTERAIFARSDEVQRIVVRFGAHEQSDVHQTVEERIESFRPQLKVHDIDGNEITMLAEDPQGATMVLPHFRPEERDDILAELDRNRQETARLIQMLEEVKNNQTAPGLDRALDDTPTKVPGPATK